MQDMLLFRRLCEAVDFNNSFESIWACPSAVFMLLLGHGVGPRHALAQQQHEASSGPGYPLILSLGIAVRPMLSVVCSYLTAPIQQASHAMPGGSFRFYPSRDQFSGT